MALTFSGSTPRDTTPTWLMAALLALVAASCTQEDGNPEGTPPLEDRTHPLPAEWVPGEGEFMVVVLPDTQIYAERFPETFESQLRWIADRAQEYRIAFVSHVGDIVQTASEEREWRVARATFDWLDDIDMPYGFSVAGHDVSGSWPEPWDSSCSPFPQTDCDIRDFRRHFGAERYTDRPWFGGASPSGMSSYQVIEAEGLALLFLHLPQDTPAEEVAWAGEVLDAHPDRLVHLTTHRYLMDYRLTSALPGPLALVRAGRFSGLTYELGNQILMYHTGLPAQTLFRSFIATHPNIFMVHCGHVDAEFRQVSRNRAGLPVHEILVDYQDMADGGGGWLRLLRFRPADDQIDVISFSTLTGAVRANGEGFDHSIDILRSYRDLAGPELERFGVDPDEADRLIEEVSTEGSPLREQYFQSLYGRGERDSVFTLDVSFQAYLDAAR